jgi:hypothetical protein
MAEPPRLCISLYIPANQAQAVEHDSFANEEPYVLCEGHLPKIGGFLPLNGYYQVLEPCKHSDEVDKIHWVAADIDECGIADMIYH